ncbi:F-box domain containing protein [Tanacetum coccineum]
MAGKYAPEDIILKIIAKLPAKPLLRFKCVSKHWDHVISEPNFLKSRSRRMILLSLNPFQAIDSNVLANDNGSSIVTLRSPEGKYVDLIGTVNGLVLLVIHVSSGPQAWATQQTLGPGPTHERPRKRTSSSRSTRSITGTRPQGAWLSQLRKTHAQRQGARASQPAVAYQDPLPRGNKGVFVNGFLYWNVCKRRKKRGNRRMLLALAVKEMVFSEIQIHFLVSQLFPWVHSKDGFA